jgi:hypothetical protein
VVCRFGMPKSLISDHGKNYKSALFAQLCKLCQIRTCNSTFYHPEGNGLVERMNKTIKQILTMYVNATHTNWDVHLQSSVSAYNTSIQASTGYSPYEVLFGRRPVVLADVVLSNTRVDAQKPVAEYVKDLRINMLDTHKKIQVKLAQSQARQKAFYDRFSTASAVFVVGDLVRLVNERSVPGQSKSFRERALGPFEVVETFNDVNFRIVCCATGKSQVVHYNRLRPYRARADAKFSSPEHPLNNEDNQLALNDGVSGVLLFMQFIIGLNQTAEDNPVDQSNAGPAVEADGIAPQEGTQAVVVVDTLPSSDDAVVLRACPVCQQEFRRVMTHIKNKKDPAHMAYRNLLENDEASLVGGEM